MKYMTTPTLKLVDLRTGQTVTRTFGTCDICLHTAPHTPEYLVFQLGDETREYETGFGDSYDYYTTIEVDNLPRFAQFVALLELTYFPDRYELEEIYHSYDDTY